jgi:hypothetical protein
VNLSAPAPRKANRKPDLTGVWMHEPTPTAELKRLFRGTLFEDEFESLPPGMDVELQSKYAWNILIDFEPNPPLRPEAVAFLQRCTPNDSRIDFRGLASLALAGRCWGCFPSRSRSSRPPKRRSFCMKLETHTGRSSPMAASSPPSSNCQHFWATPRGIGRVTPSSSRRAGSTVRGY